MITIKSGFSPFLAPKEEKRLEFRFTDRKGSDDEFFHFIIKDEMCTLKKGTADNPSAIFESTVANWQKVVSGEISRNKAIDQQLLVLKGKDFKFIRLLGEGLMGGSSSNATIKDDEIGKEKKKQPGLLRLFLDLLPWILIWTGSNYVGDFSLTLAAIVSSALLVFFRQNLTFLETVSPLLFAVGLVISRYNPWFAQNLIPIYYSVLALLWGSTLFQKMPLTGKYSASGVLPQVRHTRLFTRTNRITTGFWSLLYFLIAIGILFFESQFLYGIAIRLHLLSLLGMVFTLLFVRFYPQSLAAKGKL